MTEPRAIESLADLGERRLVTQVLMPRYRDQPGHFGDDCALVLEADAGSIVITTDPAPRPVAWELGIRDYYYWGWLLGAINFSDLAAAGAKPLTLVSSLTLPSSMRIEDFERLLDGIDDCCTLVQARVIGGNLKEATDAVIRCEATAVGVVENHEVLSRRGAVVGDVIVAFGPTGAFWAAVLTIRRGIQLGDAHDHALREALLRPVPQVALVRELRTHVEIHSCTDASDGLYAAVDSLTSAQGLGATLSLESWELAPAVVTAAAEMHVSPLRLALGFGDLQAVCTLATENLPVAAAVASALGVQLVELGRVTDDRRIMASLGGSTLEMNNFDNERFTAESQFTAGLDAYEERLLTRPILDDAG